MAVIPDVPHVVVDIVVDGNPLPEYLDEDDSESVSSNSITKYVECVSGSSFAIRTDFTGMKRQYLRGGNAIETVHYIDGQHIDGNVHKTPWTQSGAWKHRAARYKEGRTWLEREFRFADLVTCMLIA
jgi:hypothetical protein